MDRAVDTARRAPRGVAAGRASAARAGHAMALLLALLCGCALLQVTARQRASLLLPQSPAPEGYTVEDGAVTFHRGDLRVVVEAVSDAELNGLFPQESSLGEYSINPYTFGNWVDPKVGYVPNRFTVFRVTVHNEGFAKVELDPLRAVLTTDRPGEALQAYGILAGSAPRTFEAYYRARRRPSGNEYYRFNMRMGIVRSSNYGVGEKVFQGESYGGFIVFDPLDDAVTAVRLHLPDFALKFNAFDVPLETVDLVFDFERRIEVGARIVKTAAQERPWTAARLRAPSQVLGSAPADTARDAGAIDARVGAHLARINACFAASYRDGTAAEGQVDLAFVIDMEGAVADPQVRRSTVVSEAVDRCLEAEALGWDFGASRIPAELLADAPAEGPRPDRVAVEAYLEFLDVRDDR